ncbi:polysaccharide deacetylase [Saccharophagus sp. K07]|jgi:peptidoglycan/xylan/chitin deacetylase (PgdA/CDA1 family)|uniref:polysaccharide deacetylase family protein n=1 Tax=Saccharophagus sp. K07 TaxID=2283636 RepID=UPI0016523DE0|nr:polysaccharide deacetylase family protein [Saccharophagus sp. K07]MBC6904607.1 polysaccharide deacetylase [Saccharophagus sp. K07]
MSFRLPLILSSLYLALQIPISHAAPIVWPGNAKAAVSLSYDDALNSQLDNAVPALKKYGIKASFYPILSSPVLAARLPEWRKVAADGYELGNHTLFHACAKSKPGRSWVADHNDLDKKNMAQIQDELSTANAFLYAIDGKTERTLTPPCLDWEVSDGNFVEHLAHMFVGIKGAETIPSSMLLPEGVSGKELIKFVQKSAKNGGVVNIIFHGINGDHLSVSNEAHEELLKFLAKNRDMYWTDTYINIMKYVRQAGKVGVGESPN